MIQPLSPHAIEAMIVAEVMADSVTRKIATAKPEADAAEELKQFLLLVYGAAYEPDTLDRCIIAYVFERLDWQRIVRMVDRRHALNVPGSETGQVITVEARL